MGNTLEITEARKQLNGLDQRLKNERVIVVTKHNKNAFAIVDLQYLTSVLDMVEMLSDPTRMRELRQRIAPECSVQRAQFNYAPRGMLDRPSLTAATISD